MIATALSLTAFLTLSMAIVGDRPLSSASSLIWYFFPPAFTPPALLISSAASWALCWVNLPTYGSFADAVLRTIVTLSVLAGVEEPPKLHAVRNVAVAAMTPIVLACVMWSPCGDCDVARELGPLP